MDKLILYLTHDTEDIEFVNTIIDILEYMQIFDTFLSPFDLPGKMPQLDNTKKTKIENCDLLVALFTRRSLRSSLVKEEIDLARSKNKIVIPFLDHFSKNPKIGKVTGEYKKWDFIRTKPELVANRVLTIVDALQIKLGISQDSITKARRSLIEYSKQKPMLRMPKSLRMSTFRRIVAEALKNLGYSVQEQFYFVPVYSRRIIRKEFCLEATRERRRINIGCFFRTISARDVVRIARYADKRVDERWIITTGFTPKAENIASIKGINLVPIQSLLGELPPSVKESLCQRFVQLENLQDAFIVNRKFYPEFRASIRMVRCARTPVEKGRSLERLAECFVNLFSGLEVVGKNIRIEAEELDLVVKNEAETIFWQRLGAPVIIECKNWTKPVGAPEIRDLVQKMREVKTAFLIATHGVTSKDGAHYEIIEARKKTKFILVFDIWDMEEILRGTNPEEIVREKFYSLWTKA